MNFDGAQTAAGTGAHHVPLGLMAWQPSLESHFHFSGSEAGHPVFLSFSNIVFKIHHTTKLTYHLCLVFSKTFTTYIF